MTNERIKDLMADDDLNLTKEEWDEGWHFCLEFDGLLRKNEPQDDFICTCRGDGK